VTLECGHCETSTATERRKGQMYCFDCFYDKPKSKMALVILEEKGISPVANKEPEISDAQRGWERAMGMRGYLGSPAHAEDVREKRNRDQATAIDLQNNGPVGGVLAQFLSEKD
jgi:hypothetical protein